MSLKTKTAGKEARLLLGHRRIKGVSEPARAMKPSYC